MAWAPGAQGRAYTFATTAGEEITLWTLDPFTGLMSAAKVRGQQGHCTHYCYEAMAMARSTESRSVAAREVREATGMVYAHACFRYVLVCSSD